AEMPCSCHRRTIPARNPRGRSECAISSDTPNAAAAALQTPARPAPEPPRSGWDPPRARPVRAISVGRGGLVILGLKLVELHPIAQLVALEPQQLGGATLIPLRSIRGTEDQGSLQFLGHALERNAFLGNAPRQQIVDA